MSKVELMPWEEFLRKVAEHVGILSNKYEMSSRDTVIFSSLLKEFAATYYAKMMAGEIPEDQIFVIDNEAGLEFMNGYIEDGEA